MNSAREMITITFAISYGDNKASKHLGNLRISSLKNSNAPTSSTNIDMFHKKDLAGNFSIIQLALSYLMV